MSKMNVQLPSYINWYFTLWFSHPVKKENYAIWGFHSIADEDESLLENDLVLIRN